MTHEIGQKNLGSKKTLLTIQIHTFVIAKHANIKLNRLEGGLRAVNMQKSVRHAKIICVMGVDLFSFTMRHVNSQSLTISLKVTS